MGGEDGLAQTRSPQRLILQGSEDGVYREYVQNPVIATMSRNMSLLGQIFRTSKPFKINPLVYRYSGNPFPDTYSLIHQDTGYYDKFKQLQGIVLKCFADCDRFSHVFSIKAIRITGIPSQVFA